MKRVGIVGLGDMGIGLSRNILAAGFPLTGFDLRSERLAMLTEIGGRAASSPAEVGDRSEIVFVMVLNGTQVQSVVLDARGLTDTIPASS